MSQTILNALAKNKGNISIDDQKSKSPPEILQSNRRIDSYEIAEDEREGSAATVVKHLDTSSKK